MASITEAQWAGIQQRKSLADLDLFIAILVRDGELSIEGFAVPEDPGLTDEQKAAAKEAADAAIDQALAEVEAPAQGPTEEELAGNLDAAIAAGEVEEGAAQPSDSGNGNGSSLPGTHAKLDALAEDAGVEFEEGASVAEKQAALTEAGVSG